MHKRLALVLMLILLTAGTGMASGGITFEGLSVVNLVVNGTPIKSDLPPVLLGGSTFVPLRVVSTSMGASVKWDADTQTAIIDTAPITAPLERELSETRAELSLARENVADLNSKLQEAQEALASARSDLAKAREALLREMGSGSNTPALTAERYAAAVLSAQLAGPLATATLGHGSDCVPACTAWDQTMRAKMEVFSKPYLAYGLSDLSVDLLTAPYTLVKLTLSTSSKSPFSVDLTGATLSVDGNPAVKAAYMSEPRLSLETYREHTVHLVFPVAPGERASLTFPSPVRTMNLTAIMPALPENFAEYALGPELNGALVDLAAEVKANLGTFSMASFPYVDAPGAFPTALKPFAHSVSEEWIREHIGPKSPLLNGTYTYLVVTFSNDTTFVADVPPSAFATRTASGSMVQPIGFIPLDPQFVYENYNGLFIYPGHAVEVLVVYPRM